MEEEPVTITLAHDFDYNGRHFVKGENEVHPRMVRLLTELDESFTEVEDDPILGLPHEEVEQ